MIRQRAPDMPAGAIAGIDERNAASVIAGGADGIAVISALSLAPEPNRAAATLRGIVDRALAERKAG
jgi:thiamine-phosphate pyrophosphorylase